MRLYETFFIPRSGHTAVCQWMINQPEGRACSVRREAFVNGKMVAEKMPADWKAKQHAIMMCWYDSLKIVDIQEPGITVQPVVIIRSFENWLASVMRDPGGQEILPGAYFWEDLALAMLFKDDVYTSIVFDLWFQSKEYRAKVATRLGMPFSDNGLNRMFERSSFQSLVEYRFKGQELDVLNRWKVVKDEPVYAVFKDMHAELRSLIEPFFNINTTEEQLAEIRKEAKANHRHLLENRVMVNKSLVPKQTVMDQKKAQAVYDLFCVQRKLDLMGNAGGDQGAREGLMRKIEELKKVVG